MTALSEYQRLEATGVYAPEREAERVDVIVSLGQATLTITDFNNDALAHWSLAAVERLNPGTRPARFAPTGLAGEQLHLNDDEMIRAIEKVRRAVSRARPKGRAFKLRIGWILAIGVLAAALMWVPDAIVRKTASLVPDGARAPIGEAILERVIRVAGQPCDAPEGVAALDALLETLGSAGPERALVLPDGVRQAEHLPGGTVLLGRSVVEDFENPIIVAGFLLAEMERAERTDPLIPLLSHAGLPATVTLATTGKLNDEAIDGYAAALLTEAPDALSPVNVAARFAEAGVPVTPYAYAIDITGEQTLPLIEADQIAQTDARPLMTDGQWVALQGICED